MMLRTIRWAPLILAASVGAGCHDSLSVGQVTSAPVAPRAAGAASNQQNPAIARNANGDAVAVWEGFVEDGSHYDIFGQRYRRGQALGPVFRVNTHTASRQNLSAVAMDDTGRFVVVWRSSRQQGNGGTIFGQRFAADGSALGSEFQIGPANSDFDSQSEPAVAMNGAGNFVVVWGNREISAAAVRAGLTNVETRKIEARLYDAQGETIRGPFDVITPSPISIVRAPSVTMDASGNFAIAWISESNPAGIRLRSFGPNGVGDVTQTVGSPRAGTELDHPSVAMNRAGDMAVAWESVFLGTGLPDGIYYRRKPVAAAEFASEHRAATEMQERVSASLASNGTLLLTAQGNDAIYAQAFDLSDHGTPLLMLSSPDAASIIPAASLSDDGSATVVWQTYGQAERQRVVELKEISVQ